MHDGGMPEVSVDHGPARRLSWISVELSGPMASAELCTASYHDCTGSALPVGPADTPSPPPPTEPAAVASRSVTSATSLVTSLSASQSDIQPDSTADPPADPKEDPPSNPKEDPPSDPKEDPPSNPKEDPPSDSKEDPPSDPKEDPPSDPQRDLPSEASSESPPHHPPVPAAVPASYQTAADQLEARLRADAADTGEMTVLGVALVANCHVSLVIFGLFFFAAGSLLCVIAFRAPTSATGDMQSRVAGTFFLCLAAVMCTFGLCLCRLDQQLSKNDQEKGAANRGDCHIHSDASQCHRVLPSFQRARRSTQRVKKHMLRQLDERLTSAAARKHKEKTFSSIELLAATSAESVGCGRCNEAASYGTMEKIDVASFPS